jgi:hypothetical protein
LLVVDITEEGNRRPIKVARLYPLGQQRILAQLKLPDLVQLKGWKLVLSGIEELPGRRKSKSRRWTNLVCELRPPENAVGFRVKDTYTEASVCRARRSTRPPVRGVRFWSPVSIQMRYSGTPPAPRSTTTRYLRFLRSV